MPIKNFKGSPESVETAVNKFLEKIEPDNEVLAIDTMLLGDLPAEHILTTVWYEKVDLGSGLEPLYAD